ncbi:MAG TPA: acyl carrier protein [Candidatus Eremiobacteraceae bacterium]|nr:acyl carrier protein [Candidatus Eremiobacteraceae bacterium]
MAASRETTNKWLIDWLVTRGKIGKHALEKQPDTLRETDYFEEGWLSSMEVVEFVTEIEQEFAMQFSDRDLQDPRFVTIEGITELIVDRAKQSNDCT